jgi:FkbM family methyltransferase
MLRKLAERLSRGKAFKRRLPPQFGNTPIFVSPDAQLKYMKITNAAFDTELLNIACKYINEGDTVWDVGANIGVFSLAAASIVGPQGYVLAVEPDIWLANLIRRSINLPENQDLHIDVLSTAISDKTGIATFLIARRGRAANTLALTDRNSVVMGGIREKHLVTTVILDSLLDVSPPPNFIKIDVEGAEFYVLTGASQILSKIRPIIYCEVSPGNAMEIANIFKSAEYELFKVTSSGEKLPIEICDFNTLACPKEKIGSLL